MRKDRGWQDADGGQNFRLPAGIDTVSRRLLRSQLLRSHGYVPAG